MSQFLRQWLSGKVVLRLSVKSDIFYSCGKEVDYIMQWKLLFLAHLRKKRMCHLISRGDRCFYRWAGNSSSLPRKSSSDGPILVVQDSPSSERGLTARGLDGLGRASAVPQLLPGSGGGQPRRVDPGQRLEVLRRDAFVHLVCFRFNFHFLKKNHK